MAEPPTSQSDIPALYPEKPRTSESESTRGNGDDQQSLKDEIADLERRLHVVKSRLEVSESPTIEVRVDAPTIEFQDDAQTRKEREVTFRAKFRQGRASDWWFASTGIPLLAATLGPLANVSSIAALVTFWREQLFVDDQFVTEFDGIPFADPRWCYWLNVWSLICGFLGNLFLLFNFTQRIRYIIALPATIFFWYIASFVLIGITASMQIYAPPIRPDQTYTQGFWYAIAAAVLYLVCSMLLMVNMLGYFLGHYPDSFALSDSQRTLILQTMVFFIWLAGGAAMFTKIEGNAGATSWNFADSMYFCDVTLLTVGFGDLYPTTNLGRGMVFPYSVGGIIILALMVSSIYKFMREMGEENIVQKHTERMRERTAERVVTTSFDLRQRQLNQHHHLTRRRRALNTNNNPHPEISAPSNPRQMHTAISSTIRNVTWNPTNPIPKKERVLLLREEKDRFHAMRDIQHRSHKFRKWMALVISIIAFGILWCIGAVVFWQAEKHTQNMTYFQALYFSYVSLLTIGYGDLAPKSNAGRTFFVIWSLIAVPTMTILISDMGDTVVDKFKKSSDQFADFTVLPKNGIWRKYLDKHPWLVTWLRSFQAKKAIRRRLKTGFETTDPDAAPDALEEDSRNPNQNNITDSEKQHNNITSTTPPPVPALPEDRPQDPDPATASSTHLLYHRLALNINRVVADLHSPSMNPKRYDYEEWVEFTRLIHHTTHAASISLDNDDGEEGLLEWDWIGTDSPLMSGLSEPQWVLGRLCESMDRLYRSERRREVGAEGRERVTRRREVNGGGGIVGGFTTDRDDGEVEMGLEMEGFRVDDDRVSGQAMS